MYPTVSSPWVVHYALGFLWSAHTFVNNYITSISNCLIWMCPVLTLGLHIRTHYASQIDPNNLERLQCESDIPFLVGCKWLTCNSDHHRELFYSLEGTCPQVMNVSSKEILTVLILVDIREPSDQQPRPYCLAFIYVI